jgi:2,4-dienoyl-CoA reductase-like NADH-dependent reductase (Old Yellow Enzyme family)
MTTDDIKRVQKDFVDAAQRALEAGFEWLELHFAHGYLAQSFFSVHSNFRQDEYGGDFENRTRFLKETFSAVRSVWPDKFPLTVRLGVIEYDGRDDETVTESVALVKALKADGLDLLSVTLGFSTTEVQIPWGAAFLGPVTKKIRSEAALPVAAAWGIDEPRTASRLIEDGTLDLVMIGRAHLGNPHYPYSAAIALEISNPAWILPAPYAHWLARYR